MNSEGNESDVLLYTVRSLVVVRNQLPAQKRLNRRGNEFLDYPWRLVRGLKQPSLLEGWRRVARESRARSAR